MILPIGSNCCVALALKNTNIRKYAYPFDWIDSKSFDFIIDCLTVNDDKLNEFIHKLFTENITTETLKYNNHTYIINKTYNIGFVHDNIEDIEDKYTRRINRLRNHFNNDKTVDIVYSTRWETDERLDTFINKIHKLRPDAKLHVINAMKSSNSPLTYIYTIDYKEEYVPFVNDTERNWSYDKVYGKLLMELFQKIFT